MESLPQKQKAVVLRDKGVLEYDASIKDVPKPASGQVLIKIESAPINPSDLYQMRGDYAGKFQYPLIPGTEGSGTVIASGGGLMAWSLQGKRVGFTREADRPGTYKNGGSYAEYAVTNAYQCIVLDANVSFDQGACSFVNPVTAIGLLDRCHFYKAKAAVQTGASSQLGRMCIKLFKQNNLPLVNIVRREEQVELLKKEHGAEYVLNSTSETFDKDLEEICEKLQVSVALECVSGDMPGRLLRCMGHKAVVISYGALSDQNIGPINPAIMIFKAQKIEAFLLPYWLKTKSMYQQYSAVQAAKKLVPDTQVSKKYGLHQVNEAIEYYKANMTAGKVFLNPSLTE
jgi:NADPH2:quinone reductase